jgi:hypothetical protein
MWQAPHHDRSFDLQRFLDAQSSVCPRVLDELRRGRKQSHWIWFIFPQFAGLRYSVTAQRFAIFSREDAVAYLRHDVLGVRLRVHCARQRRRGPYHLANPWQPRRRQIPFVNDTLRSHFVRAGVRRRYFKNSMAAGRTKRRWTCSRPRAVGRSKRMLPICWPGNPLGSPTRNRQAGNDSDKNAYATQARGKRMRAICIAPARGEGRNPLYRCSTKRFWPPLLGGCENLVVIQ